MDEEYFEIVIEHLGEILDSYEEIEDQKPIQNNWSRAVLTHHIESGLYLRSKNDTVVEYALKDIHKPIEVSEYIITKNLSYEFHSSLPGIEEIEAEFRWEMMSSMPKERKIQICNSTAEFLIFSKQAGNNTIEVRIEDETVWLSQKMLATLFEVWPDKEIVQRIVAQIPWRINLMFLEKMGFSV